MKVKEMYFITKCMHTITPLNANYYWSEKIKPITWILDFFFLLIAFLFTISVILIDGYSRRASARKRER